MASTDICVVPQPARELAGADIEVVGQVGLLQHGLGGQSACMLGDTHAIRVYLQSSAEHGTERILRPGAIG